jgi:hypothetical protein
MLPQRRQEPIDFLVLELPGKRGRFQGLPFPEPGDRLCLLFRGSLSHGWPTDKFEEEMRITKKCV